MSESIDHLNHMDYNLTDYLKNIYWIELEKEEVDKIAEVARKGYELKESDSINIIKTESPSEFPDSSPEEAQTTIGNLKESLNKDQKSLWGIDYNSDDLDKLTGILTSSLIDFNNILVNGFEWDLDTEAWNTKVEVYEIFMRKVDAICESIYSSPEGWIRADEQDFYTFFARYEEFNKKMKTSWPDFMKDHPYLREIVRKMEGKFASLQESLNTQISR